MEQITEMFQQKRASKSVSSEGALLSDKLYIHLWLKRQMQILILFAYCR